MIYVLNIFFQNKTFGDSLEMLYISNLLELITHRTVQWQIVWARVPLPYLEYRRIVISATSTRLRPSSGWKRRPRTISGRWRSCYSPRNSSLPSRCSVLLDLCLLCTGSLCTGKLLKSNIIKKLKGIKFGLNISATVNFTKWNGFLSY